MDTEPENYLNEVLTSQGDGTGTADQVVAIKTITAATNASPNVYTLTSHGYSDGDYVFIEGETGSTTANGLRIVAAKTTHTFQLTTPAGDAINSDGTFAGTVTCALAFTYKPASTIKSRVESLGVIANDTVNDATKYFNVTALANGILVRVFADNGTTVVQNLTPTEGVKTWQGWAQFAEVKTETGDSGAGTVTQGSAKWRFPGSGLVLNGNRGDVLAVVYRTAITGVTTQQMAISGTDGTISS